MLLAGNAVMGLIFDMAGVTQQAMQPIHGSMVHAKCKDIHIHSESSALMHGTAMRQAGAVFLVAY